MKKLILAAIALLFFIGCDTSSSTTDIANDHPLEPKINISNLKLTNNSLTGNIKLSENNNFYMDATFTNIHINSNECNITNFKLSKNTLKNNEETNFTITTNCSKIPTTINVSFDETASYMDNNVKNIKKSFTKEVTIIQNSTKNETNTTTTAIITKAFLQPSSVILKNGDQFTFYVYTFDENNNPISVPVKINPPIDTKGQIIGEFNTYLIQTNKNGKGSFTYIAPNTLKENNITLNIPIIFNNDIEKNLTIQLQKQKKVTIYPTKLILVPNSISVTGGSSYTITILTLDNNNRGISSTVLISHPIDNKNNSWGNFDKYIITTDENGEGSVTFTATNNLTNLENNLSVPVTIQSTGLTANLLLVKAPAASKETISYDIKYNAPSSIQIEKDFSINIQVINNNTQQLVDNNNISEINLTSENHLIYFDNNKTKFQTTIKNNNLNVPATALTTSGIDIIDVNATIDTNGSKQNISKQIPIVIISGPVSAISINPVSSTYNSDTGLFEHIYSIHAVDKYSNPVHAGTKITVGAVVNNKITGNNGELKPIQGSDTSKFYDSSKNFTNDLINNTLIIIANQNHTSPSYLGGWIIQNIEDSTHLILASAFSGSDTTGLSYVIGDEKRFNSCDSTLAVADFDSSDKTYETNSNGIAMVKLRFDPYLIGKTITLYANSYQDKRVGISIKKILFNNNLLTLESNEDNNATTDHSNGIWEKTGNKNDKISGIIYIGTNGGPYNTVLSSSSSTLAKNTPVTLEVLTPSICTFNDGSTTKQFTTDCNGAINFDVNYTNDGLCKINLNGINYEY